MSRIYVGVLGPTEVRVEGNAMHLAPLTVRLLLRLIIAEGDAVTASQLYRDVWEEQRGGRITREDRNQVQKRVLYLRRCLEPEAAGTGSRLLPVERVLLSRAPEWAYRLHLGRDQLDYLEFTDLVNGATRVAPATAAAMLTRALGLWRGQPLADAAGWELARPLVRRLLALRDAARWELIRAQGELGHPELALPVAEELAAESPDDPEVITAVDSLRRELRQRNAGDVLRREFSGLGVTLVIRQGDLFEQHDANLAIGFSDTYDTATDDDVLISRESVQGQLLARVYRNDRKRLDADLRKALRKIVPVDTETARDKPKGKRKRYAVGTVVPVPLDGRRIFAFVHCRQGLDLVTRSSAAELRLSLDELWRSARTHGIRKPLAIPLVGSGLARTQLSREQVMIMIINSFLRSSAATQCTPELRIVVWPPDLAKIRMSDIARFVEALDKDGRGPDE